MRARVHACERACVHACVCVLEGTKDNDHSDLDSG